MTHSLAPQSPLSGLKNTTANTPIVSLDQVSVLFGQTTALNAVSLKLNQGELVSLIGPNGAGKSTLVKVILGMIKPSKGARHTKDGIIMAYVPQKLEIPSSIPMRVKDLFALESNDLQKIASLSQLTNCTSLLNQQVHALSGGQMQCVSLTRALLRSPDLLILDEPTQGLDPEAEVIINQIISSLPAQFGCTVLVISHDLNWVLSGTKRVICLNKHICCTGTSEDISQQPAYLNLYGLPRVQYHHHHDHCSHHDHPSSIPSPLTE